MINGLEAENIVFFFFWGECVGLRETATQAVVSSRNRSAPQLGKFSIGLTLNKSHPRSAQDPKALWSPVLGMERARLERTKHPLPALRPRLKTDGISDLEN